MSAPPTPEQACSITSADLDELLEVGMTLAREIAAAAAAAKPKDLLHLATAYERVSRAIRRTILLVHRLANPAAAPQPARTPSAAAAAPARPGLDRPPLGAATERAEQLDRPESIDGIPTEIVVAGIRQDLGLDPVAPAPTARPQPAPAPTGAGQGPWSPAHRADGPHSTPLRTPHAPDTG